MTKPMTRGLDHAVHAVHDLEAARARYETLGFTTTPRALHPWGTGNSLVQLDRSFVEILGVESPDRIRGPGEGEFSFGDFNQRFLRVREGMSMLVFSSSDARADRERWLAAGLETYAPFDFSRSATLPGGEQVTVAFSLAFVTHPGMPCAAWFVCQQHHPEHFWKRDYQSHANGAASMRCVWVLAEDPDRYLPFLEALFPGEATVSGVAGGVDLVLGYGRVAVRTPVALARRFPELSLPAAGQGPAFVAVTMARAAGSGELRRDTIDGLLVEIEAP